MNILGHAGLFRMVAGQAERLGVDVVTQQSFGQRRMGGVAGFVAGQLPMAAVRRRPRLGNEFAM